MDWINSIVTAIDYIEKNIKNDLTVNEIANCIHISPFYFQKAFTMLCGLTVGEYLRLRRLSLAGSEIVSTDKKIIDIALDYGYDSPDSFTKAFTRFNGATPTAVRKNGAILKTYAPLHIFFELKGGFTMDYKIIDKEAFTVIGSCKKFDYETGMIEIPKFWKQHYDEGKGATVCGMYGISIDPVIEDNEYDYLIADDYKGDREVPEGFITKTIPAFTWAVFPCVGAMPDALQTVSKNIFSEWLPNNKEYEMAGGYLVEMYADPTKYKKGTLDENYYCEMWIAVKKK